jgi:SEC-C motif-containing protein
MTSAAPTAPCPCGSGSALATCCGIYLNGAAAPTPEALMRSRYTAYALRNGDYVSATWHPSSRPARLDLKTEATRWLGLTLVEAPPPNPDGTGEVEFSADFIADGCRQTLHETSRFLREDGRWYYLDGEARWERRKPPGRNDPCWCGSGKKFKKCCGG